MIWRKKKNVLNNVKKIIKSVKRSPQTKFSSQIVRKDKKNKDKEVLDTNARLRNFCNQKNIDKIDANIHVTKFFQNEKRLTKLLVLVLFFTWSVASYLNFC